MRRFSACLEMLFVEEPDFAKRVALAKAAGFTAVEFWRWTNKDLLALKAALDAADMPVAALVAEPMIALTDPANHAAFLDGLEDTIATAQLLGAPVLIAQTGNDLGNSRDDQRAALIAGLKAAANLLAGTGVLLGIEPLNTLVDHKGYFLSDTLEGFAIIDQVDRPEIGMVYDIYHSAVMGEPADVIKGRAHQIYHVHLADHPGRNEPGSGQVDLDARMQVLEAEGYAGAFGCEFRPTTDSQSASAAVFQKLA
ncbi:MAG: TIM barrel protein [Deltaproteobacteria bacterium]